MIKYKMFILLMLLVFTTIPSCMAVVNREILLPYTFWGNQWSLGSSLSVTQSYPAPSLNIIGTFSAYVSGAGFSFPVYRGSNLLANATYIHFGEAPSDLATGVMPPTDPPRVTVFSSTLDANATEDGYWSACIPWFNNGTLRGRNLGGGPNTMLNMTQSSTTTQACWGLSGTVFSISPYRRIIIYNRELAGAPVQSSSIVIQNVVIDNVNGPQYTQVYNESFTANRAGIPLDQTAVMSPNGNSYAFGYTDGTIKVVYNQTTPQVISLHSSNDIPFSLDMSQYGNVLIYGSPNTTIPSTGLQGKVVLYEYNNATNSYNTSNPTILVYPYRYAGDRQGYSVQTDYTGTVVAVGMPFGLNSAGAVALWRKYSSGVWIPSQIPYTRFGDIPTNANSTNPLYTGWSVQLLKPAPVTKLYAGAPAKRNQASGFVLFYDDIMTRVFPTVLPSLPAWQELFIPTTLTESSVLNSLSLHLGTSSGLYSLTVSRSSVNGTSNYRYLTTTFAKDLFSSYNVINAPQTIGQLATPPTVVSGSGTDSIGCLSEDGLKFAKIDLARADGVKVLEIGVRAAEGLPWVFLAQNQFTLSNSYTFFDIVCSPSLQFISVMNVYTLSNSTSMLATYMTKNSSAITEWSIIYTLTLPADTVSTFVNMSRQNAYLGISQNGRRLFIYNRNTNVVFTYITANGQFYSSTSMVSIMPLNSTTVLHSIASDYYGYQMVVSIEVSSTINVYSYTVVGNGGHFATTPTSISPSTNTIPSISGGLALCKSGRTLFIGSRTAGGVLSPCTMTRANFKTSLTWIYNGTSVMVPYGTVNGTIIGRFDRRIITDDGKQGSVRSAYTDSILTFNQMPGNTASDCTTLETMPPTPIVLTGNGDINGVINCPTADELGFSYQMCGFSSYYTPDGNTLALLGIRRDNLRAFAAIKIRIPNANNQSLSTWSFWKAINIGPIVTNNMTDTLLNWRTPPNAVIRISIDRRIVVIGSGWKPSVSSIQTEPVFVYWYNNVTSLYQNSQNITNPIQSDIPFNFGTSLELIRTGLQLSINVFSFIPNYGRVLVYRLPTTNTNIENQQFYRVQTVEAAAPGSGANWAHQISASAYGTTLSVAHGTDYVDFYTSPIITGLYSFVSRVSIGTSREIISLKMSGNGLTCFVNTKSSTSSASFIIVINYDTVSETWSTNTSAPIIYPSTLELSAIYGAIGTDDGGHLITFPIWSPNNMVPIWNATHVYGYNSNALLSNTTFDWYNTPGEILTTQFVSSLSGRPYSQGQVKGNTYNINAMGSMMAVNVLYQINLTEISGGVIMYATGQFFQSAVSSPGNFPPSTIPPLTPPIPPITPPQVEEPQVVLPPVYPPVTQPFSPHNNPIVPLQRRVENEKKMATTGLIIGVVGMVAIVVGSVVTYIYFSRDNDGNVSKPHKI